MEGWGDYHVSGSPGNLGQPGKKMGPSFAGVENGRNVVLREVNAPVRHL